MVVRTKLDEKAMKEMQKKYCTASIGCLCFASAGLIVSVLLGIGFPSTSIGYASIVFAVVIILCIVSIVNCKKVEKKFGKKQLDNVYVFYDEYIDINTMRIEEITQSTKLYYSDIFKIVETKEYFFLFIDKMHSYPILKENIPDMSRFISLIYKSKGVKK